MPIDKINLPYHTNYKIEPEIPANQKFSAEELNQIAGKIDEVIDVVNINVADIVILKSDNLNIKNDILNLKAKDVILQNKIDQLEQNDILFDTRIDILEDTQYIWNSTNRHIEVYRGGSLFSTVSLVSLDNEGTDLRYNSNTKSLELYNDDGELLDSIPIEDFVGNVATQLTLSSNTLSLKDSQGNVLSSVGFQVSNIGGLTNLLANLDTRIANEEILRASEDLKKLDNPTADGTWVVTKSGSTISYTDASTLGQNISNANLTWTADRTQNLGTKKLSFTNGRFSVPTLEMEVTSANSIPNKIWNDGIDIFMTTSSGVNKNIGGDIKTEQVIVTGNTTVLESWRGKIVIIKNSSLITVPNNLSSGFSFQFLIDAGVTLNWSLNSPRVWKWAIFPNMSEKQIGTFLQEQGTNNTYILGI